MGADEPNLSVTPLTQRRTHSHWSVDRSFQLPLILKRLQPLIVPLSRSISRDDPAVLEASVVVLVLVLVVVVVVVVYILSALSWLDGSIRGVV